MILSKIRTKEERKPVCYSIGMSGYKSFPTPPVSHIIVYSLYEMISNRILTKDVETLSFSRMRILVHIKCSIRIAQENLMSGIA